MAHLRSAGRDGSASVDELIDFGSRKSGRVLLRGIARRRRPGAQGSAAFDAACDAALAQASRFEHAG